MKVLKKFTFRLTKDGCGYQFWQVYNPVKKKWESCNFTKMRVCDIVGHNIAIGEKAGKFLRKKCLRCNLKGSDIIDTTPL